MLRLSQSIDIDVQYDGLIPGVCLHEISIIIPVRNNASGIDNFLSAFFELHDRSDYPKEIVIVDNNSFVPLVVSERHLGHGLPITVSKCCKSGPAAARNHGAKTATGEWILFTDSDCIPTATLLRAYARASGDAVAYTGNVFGVPDSMLAKYYNSEGTLIPYFKNTSFNMIAPLYLVTANALVWKKAFDMCGGFNEIFTGAGGEDVDLGRRLWSIGPLKHVAGSIVQHDFSDGLKGFCKRFHRYGMGNRQFEKLTGITMRPNLRYPKFNKPIFIALMMLQHVCLCLGYYWSGRPRKL